MSRWSVLLLALGCAPPSTPDPGPDWDERPIRERCFSGIGDPDLGLPEYDAYDPIVGRHCAGTAHQRIEDISRVVFLGDSVTAGTPPTDPLDYYRARLERRLAIAWPDLQAESCARWGAETRDLLAGGRQIEECFIAPADGPVLVVMTLGGNDMFRIARRLNDGRIDGAAAVVEAGDAVARLDEALAFFDENDALFPHGVHVVFANVYEFTDGQGDLGSCPNAGFFGFDATLPEMRAAYVAVNEGYMEIAVRRQRDLVFLLESFCGHGFHAGDPENECYRGADAETWFDGTCLHPTAQGHREIADLFEAVIHNPGTSR